MPILIVLDDGDNIPETKREIQQFMERQILAQLPVGSACMRLPTPTVPATFAGTPNSGEAIMLKAQELYKQVLGKTRFILHPLHRVRSGIKLTELLIVYRTGNRRH